MGRPLVDLQRMNAPLPLSAFTASDRAAGDTATSCGSGPAPVVVIGGGPAGIRVGQELARRGIETIIFNAERWLPYNRVKLTPLLCGDVQLGQVAQPLTFPGPGRVALYSGHSIVDIDRERKTVTGRFGRVWPYSKLVICTGSRAHVPPIPGRELAGVFTFRNFDDVEKLVARSLSSRRTVIIGGGLLGLEAARGMAARGTETCVIEHERHLMARQIDDAAGALLAELISDLGLTVRTGRSVTRITGRERVEGLELSGGEPIACDTVILCTGIRANLELARDVGLAVGRGIKVSATMQTSDPDIYAVGECAEFDGQVYGLVGPAFEQARVAAQHIGGEPVAYAGSLPVTKLKVAGIDVFSMGDVEQLEHRSDVRWLSFRSGSGDVYRKLVVQRGRLVGAIALGDWSEINRLQEAIRNRARLLPWQRLRFAVCGRLWAERTPASVREWPRTATVCNCTGVTRGQIGDAIALGCTCVDDVKRDTGASTVCGSCGPLVIELLGVPAERQAAAAFRPLGALALAAALLALSTLVLPVWPVAERIEARSLGDLLWLDGGCKQVSGYTLLLLSIAAAVLSLRKRVAWLRLGGFATWRVIHAGIGAAALLALFLHTGFRLGSNLNQWLMLSFLGTAIAGSAAGAATALQHRLMATAEKAARVRLAAFWLHLVAFWPLPLLLAVHVLAVYFY